MISGNVLAKEQELTTSNEADFANLQIRYGFNQDHIDFLNGGMNGGLVQLEEQLALHRLKVNAIELQVTKMRYRYYLHSKLFHQC